MTILNNGQIVNVQFILVDETRASFVVVTDTWTARFSSESWDGHHGQITIDQTVDLSRVSESLLIVVNAPCIQIDETNEGAYFARETCAFVRVDTGECMFGVWWEGCECCGESDSGPFVRV